MCCSTVASPLKYSIHFTINSMYGNPRSITFPHRSHRRDRPICVPQFNISKRTLPPPTDCTASRRAPNTPLKHPPRPRSAQCSPPRAPWYRSRQTDRVRYRRRRCRVSSNASAVPAQRAQGGCDSFPPGAAKSFSCRAGILLS